MEAYVEANSIPDESEAPSGKEKIRLDRAQTEELAAELREIQQFEQEQRKMRSPRSD